MATTTAVAAAAATDAKAAMAALLRPPPNRGMTLATWDRSAFTLRLETHALRVDARQCQGLLKSMNGALLGVPRRRTVEPDDVAGSTKRRVILSPGTVPPLPEPAQSLLDQGEAELLPHTVTLEYDYWTSEQILGSVLPADVIVPSAFETVGHIAHLNLKEMHEPYKDIIGAVLLEKHQPGIETVINKVDTIDTQFRFFKMEVLAGRPDTNAEVSENGCLFRFDYAKVYWNSRLHTEHRRLVDSFAKDAVICDLFAGVGPFAIPAGKKGCTVHANDLNPASYDALQGNIVHNKVEGRVMAYNLDARACVARVVRPLLTAGRQAVNHVVMNLPASAIEFLDAFKGVGLGIVGLAASDLPLVHCYCFTSVLDAPVADILQRVEAVLGSALDQTTAKLTLVRSVAPGKDMYCCAFPLPLAVALAASDASSTDAPAPKRLKPDPATDDAS